MDPSHEPNAPLELSANLEWWNEKASIHPETPMYRRSIQHLRDGGVALHALERDEVGEVAGRTLLHLQCHIGTDTLSWARLGARATGVDFSPVAVDTARRLSAELGIPARFVHTSIEELDEHLPVGAETDAYDIVFSSYGAVLWIRDLTTWARKIAARLRPGGFFYLADGHPAAMTLDVDRDAAEFCLQVRYPYFASGEALRWNEPGTYAGRDVETQHDVTYEWPHSIAEVLTALIDAGLAIEQFHEHPHCVWPAFPGMTEEPDGTYHLPASFRGRVPMMYSLRARRP
ncbi:MAG: methyltransferase domain-containing protein [Planctomycetes bacterium]|nr:methyltransferase domain-containing protein [Planctomycetota bacterium]